MSYTTISRIVTQKVANFREWLEFTGKDHLHHRLTTLGLSAKQTVLFIYFLTASLGMSALVLKNGRVIDALLLLIQAVFILHHYCHIDDKRKNKNQKERR